MHRCAFTLQQRKHRFVGRARVMGGNQFLVLPTIRAEVSEPVVADQHEQKFFGRE